MLMAGFTLPTLKTLRGSPEHLAALFMRQLIAKYRPWTHGKHGELSPEQLDKESKRFAFRMNLRGFYVDSAQLLQECITRGWLEPSAAETWQAQKD